MAGEQTGKFYESLVSYILSEAKKSTGFSACTVEREQDLPGVSIRSDVVLRAKDGQARAVFLVTHSRIEVHWAEKFKRDSAEFLELATSNNAPLIIGLIVFDARTLPGLERIAASFFTDTIKVSHIDVDKVIENYGHQRVVLEDSAKLSASAFSDFIQKKVDVDPELGVVISKLVSHFRLLLGKPRKVSTDSASFVSLTKAMVTERSPAWTSRSIRSTRFNRAISKLALFDGPEIASISKSLPISGEHKWGLHPVFWPKNGAKKGELLARSLGAKLRCVDPEIIGGHVGAEGSGYDIDSIFKALSSREIERIILAGSQSMMARYKARIRSPDVIRLAVEFLADQRAKITNKKTLHKLFKEVAQDPNGAFIANVGEEPSIPIDWHWLYTAIVALLKAESGKKQGFGYSKIAAAMPTASHARAVEHSILQNYEYGLRRVSDGIIEEVAAVLADRLHLLSADRIRSSIDAACKFLVWCEVEDKVIPHGIDVLPAMIKLAFQDAGSPLATTSITSCLAESVSASGTSGRTNIFRSADTLIWYKAVHGGHANDKRKEVQSIISTWRHKWDPKLDSFRPNKEFRKALLVIDGVWREEDLMKLHAYGWDEFFYPDQLDQLIESVE